ncbi:MAG: ABC transporter ATP-binding protein [Candidatus Shapirobacteria bacterium]|jgi:Fe-S cluster assembly ATP-binding protein
MLKISNLLVRIEDKEALRGVDLEVGDGEIVVVFGPNGSGKTTLLRTIMGLRKPEELSGKIELNGVEIQDLSIEGRAKMGVVLMFQRPPKIKGLNLKSLVGTFNTDPVLVDKMVKKLKMEKFLARGVNDNLSGGEIKRSELFQLSLQKASLYLFDEPDSGVDIESIEKLSKHIKSLVSGGKSALVVTHNGSILNYLKADRAYVMMDGMIYCSGDPREVFKSITRKGYQGCINCLNRKT